MLAKYPQPSSDTIFLCAAPIAATGRYRREMRDELREATVAAEAMQRLTQLATVEDAAKAAELETVRAMIA